MNYESLKKIFYTHRSQHKENYEKRFSAPFAVHIPFEIKQFNRNKSFTVFYNYNEELVLLLEKIYKQNIILLNLIPKIPAKVLEQFQLSCVVDEVHSTSAIEGINSTHRELQEILEGNSHSKHFSSIIKKYDLLRSGEEFFFDTCEDIRSFYDDFAHEDIAHERPSNKLDGKIFRTDYVDIKSSSGKILHRGVYPEDKIIEAMNTALHILHNENIPDMIRIAIFHYLFVYIHPFYDGNGRTARFISSYFLAKSFHFLPALRLSYVIKKQKTDYYDLIHDTELEVNCGDLTPFILGFCSFFHQSILEICRTLTHKDKQIHHYEIKILQLFQDDKLMLDICLTLLYSSSFLGQGVTMDYLVEITKKTRNTIKNKLASLPENFLTVTKKNRKNFYKLNAMIFKNL